MLGAGLAGTLGAVYVQRLVWRRVYRMEPEEIASLREVRDAMLHGLGEGMVAVDEHGRVALANDQARQMLDLPDDCVGRPAGGPDEPRGLLAAAGRAGMLVLDGEQIRARGRAVVDGRDVGSVLPATAPRSTPWSATRRGA